MRPAGVCSGDWSGMPHHRKELARDRMPVGITNPALRTARQGLADVDGGCPRRDPAQCGADRERMLGANPLWSVPADPPARPADMADERLLGQPMPRPPALDVGQEP